MVHGAILCHIGHHLDLWIVILSAVFNFKRFQWEHQNVLSISQVEISFACLS